MRIALFGPPGAGKGTQAAHLERRFGLRSISTGHLIREARRRGTAEGMEAHRFVEKGALVPDALVSRIAEQAIEDCGFDGLLLDGYPRTVAQARSLDAFLDRHDVPLDAVVVLRLDEEAIVSRLSERRVHRETGTAYHLVHNPPPHGMSPDMLLRRADDHPDAVRRRLSEYRALTEPVLAYYEGRVHLVGIDAAGSIPDVATRVMAAMERLTRLVPV